MLGASGKMRRRACVGLLAMAGAGCPQGQPALRAPHEDGTVAAIARCVPSSTKTTYVVCVVDEAGRAIAGAEVHAVRVIEGEGYGDVAAVRKDLGQQPTDLAGRATFAVPPVRSTFMVRFREEAREAFASANGWPAQRIGDDGRIVLGPPQSVVVRTSQHACDGTVRVEVRAIGGDFAPEPKRQPDGSFTVEIGPGPYTATVGTCPDGYSASETKPFLGKDGSVEID